MYQVSQVPFSTPVSNSTLLPLLLLSLARQRHTPKTATEIKTEYDYVIVGAGSAGSVVANRLSEISCVNILLLEAGPPPPILTEVPALLRSAINSYVDWSYKTVPQKYTGRGLIGRQVNYPRGKTLGGSSVLNGMTYIRGNRHNFNDWAAEGATGWSYKDVLPYFKKSEDNRNPEYAVNGYHGVGGPQTVEKPRYAAELKAPLIKSALQMGYEFVDSNADRQTGFNDHQTFYRDNQRCSTAKAYLVPAENRTNLDILPNAMVRKVIIKNRRAVGVTFDHLGSTYEVRAKREVILSAGSINTPQILMLSGIGPQEELEKFNIETKANLPVGRNLHDHIGALQTYVVDPSIETFAEKIVDPENILNYIYNRTGPLTSNGAQILQAFLNNDYKMKEDFPDFEMLLVEITSEGIDNFVGLKPEVYSQVYEPYEGKPLLSCIPFVLQPKSRGCVTLNSADPYDPPLIDPNFLEDPSDVDTVVQGLKVCNRFAQSRYLRDFGVRPISTLYPGCEKYAMSEDEYFRCQVRSAVFGIYHPVSTAKMGDPKDPTTVVDPYLRVKYIKGLRVVDASVMPIIPSGNINAATIMIGEKASDIIKKSIKCEEYENEDSDYKDFSDLFDEEPWRQKNLNEPSIIKKTKRNFG